MKQSLAVYLQRGGATVEYLVVALFATIVLFGSYDGGESVVIRLVRSMADYFATLTYLISMP